MELAVGIIVVAGTTAISVISKRLTLVVMGAISTYRQKRRLWLYYKRLLDTDKDIVIGV